DGLQAFQFGELSLFLLHGLEHLFIGLFRIGRDFFLFLAKGLQLFHLFFLFLAQTRVTVKQAVVPFGDQPDRFETGEKLPEGFGFQQGNHVTDFALLVQLAEPVFEYFLVLFLFVLCSYHVFSNHGDLLFVPFHFLFLLPNRIFVIVAAFVQLVPVLLDRTFLLLAFFQLLFLPTPLVGGHPTR